MNQHSRFAEDSTMDVSLLTQEQADVGASKISGDIEALKSRREGLKLVNNRTMREISAVEIEIQNLRAEMEKLQRWSSINVSQLDKFDAKIYQAQRELELSEQKLSEADARFVQLQSETQTANASIMSSRMRLHIQHTTFVTLMEQYSNVLAQRKQSQAEIEELQRQLERLREQTRAVTDTNEQTLVLLPSDFSKTLNRI